MYSFGIPARLWLFRALCAGNLTKHVAAWPSINAVVDGPTLGDPELGKESLITRDEP